MQIKLAALVLLFAGSVALAQTGVQPPKKPAEAKKPSALEELLAQALRDNPDVRVAEAKTHEAEAELNRARLLVIQKVVAHQHNVETLQSAIKMAEAKATVAEANVRLAEAEYQRLLQLVKQGAVAKPDVDAAQARVKQAMADIETARAGLQAAKADLAKGQAELPYLLGKGTKQEKTDETVTQALRWLVARQQIHNDRVDALTDLAVAQLAPQGTVAYKLRKALGTTVRLDGPEGIDLSSVLSDLQKAAGVPVVSTLPRDTKLAATINLQNVSLAAAFQCVEDVAGLQFGVRDYGILVSDKLGSGVMRLRDFEKQGEKAKTAPAKP